MSKALKGKATAKAAIAKSFLQGVRDQHVDRNLEASTYGSEAQDGYHKLNVIKEGFALIRGIGSVKDYNLKRYFLLDRMPRESMGDVQAVEVIEGQRTAPSHAQGCIFYFVTLYDWQKFREMTSAYTFASNEFKDLFKEHVRGVIPLQNCEVAYTEQKEDKKFEFRVITPDRTYDIICDSAQLRRDWVNAIKNVVEKDTEEAIMRFEDEQIELNMSMDGGEEKNQEILAKREERQAELARKQAEREAEDKRLREEEEKRRRDEEARLQKQSGAASKFAALKSDNGELNSGDFKEGDHKSDDDEDNRKWNVEKIESLYNQRCQELWNELHKLRPDIPPKDYQNARGEFDLEKLTAGLKTQCERSFKLLGTLNSDIKKSSVSTAQGKWNASALKAALDAEGEKLFESLRTLSPDTKRESFLSEQGLWDFTKLHAALNEECESSFSLLEQLAPGSKKGEYIGKDDSTNVPALLGALSKEGDKLWAQTQILNSDLKKNDFMTNGVWNFDKLRYQLKIEGDKAWKTLSDCNSLLKQENFRDAQGNWNVEALINGLQQEGQKLFSRMSILDSSVTIDDYKATNALWDYSKLLENFDKHCAQLFHKLQRLNPDAREANYEMANHRWSFPKLMVALDIEGTKFFETLAEIVDSVDKTSYKEKHSSSDKIEDPSFEETYELWNFEKLLEDLQKEGVTLWNTLHRLDPEQSPKDYKQRIPVPSDGYVPRKSSEPDEKELEEARDLILSLVEERGSQLVYFPEIYDKFRFELPKNEKLMFLLQETPELEINEESRFIAHAKIRQNYKRIGELLLQHISQELSFDYIRDSVDIDLSEPKNESLLKSLQRSGNFHVDIEESTVTYASNLMGKLHKIAEFAKTRDGSSISLNEVKESLSIDLHEDEMLLNFVKQNVDLAVDPTTNAISYKGTVRQHFRDVLKYVLSKKENRTVTYDKIRKHTKVELKEDDEVRKMLIDVEDVRVNEKDCLVHHLGKLNKRMEKIVNFAQARGISSPISFNEIQEQLEIDLVSDGNFDLLAILAREKSLTFRLEFATFWFNGGKEQLWRDLDHAKPSEFAKKEVESKGEFDYEKLNEALDKVGFDLYHELNLIDEETTMDDYMDQEKSGQWQIYKLRAALSRAQDTKHEKDISRLTSYLLKQQADKQIPFSTIKSALDIDLHRDAELVKSLEKSDDIRLNDDETVSHRGVLRTKVESVINFLRESHAGTETAFAVIAHGTNVDLETEKRVLECCQNLRHVTINEAEETMTHTGEEEDWDIKKLQDGLERQGHKLWSQLVKLNEGLSRDDFVKASGLWDFEKLESTLFEEGETIWKRLKSHNSQIERSKFITEADNGVKRWDFDLLNEHLELAYKATGLWKSLESLQDVLLAQVRAGALSGLLVCMRKRALEKPLREAIIAELSPGEQKKAEAVDSEREHIALFRQLGDAHMKDAISELNSEHTKALLQHIDYSAVQKTILSSLVGDKLKNSQETFLSNTGEWNFKRIEESIMEFQETLDKLQKETERLEELEKQKREKLDDFRQNMRMNAEQKAKAVAEQSKRDKVVYDKFIAVGSKGTQFLKHNYHRRQAASTREVRIILKKGSTNHDNDLIRWGKPGKSSSSHELKIKDIHSVQKGKRTAVFRQAKDGKEKSTKDNTFSIISKSRTLDLQAIDAETRDTWVNGLSVMINRYKRHTQGDLEELLDDDLRFPTTQGNLGDWRPVSPNVKEKVQRRLTFPSTPVTGQIDLEGVEKKPKMVKPKSLANPST